VIRVENMAVRAGSFTLANLSFQIPGGHYGVLMGKTGSGKTTILEAICGLKRISEGCISLNGTDITHLKPAARGIGYVPQDRALFPTMTVGEHLAFALTISGWMRADIDDRVSELAALLGLEHLIDRHPAGLSGGEAQRVALGRALSRKPSTLCLDEPLSALDDETRAEMCAVLGRVRECTGVTVLHVTHSLEEAERLADVLFNLRDGKLDIADGKLCGAAMLKPVRFAAVVSSGRRPPPGKNCPV
jgi:molybdate/tungstate transport system ATP-binding protein